jgi:hypothetical protein
MLERILACSFHVFIKFGQLRKVCFLKNCEIVQLLEFRGESVSFVDAFVYECLILGIFGCFPFFLAA